MKAETHQQAKLLGGGGGSESGSWGREAWMDEPNGGGWGLTCGKRNGKSWNGVI